MAVFRTRRQSYTSSPMRFSRVASLGTVLCVGVMFATPLAAAEPTAEDRARAENPPASGDQVIVTGRAVTRLRLRVRLDEDAVYARFNEINSDDRFDVLCEMSAATGTRIEQRVCQSKGSAAADADYASASVAQVRGELGPVPEQFRAQKFYEEQLLKEEFRRLAAEDSALREDLIRLGRAYQALDVLNGGGQSLTLYREIGTGEERLPADAKHMFHVRVGPVPWTQLLTDRTFTFTAVSGRIRGLRVECDHGHTNLKFQDDAEWTLPAAWGECHLTVYAKRDTTFAFVEFE